MLPREALKNYTFKGTKITIPKGTKVWIPAFPIHRDPNIYPDPDKFDPERFTEEAVANRHPMSFLAFGDGPRICIGMENFHILTICDFHGYVSNRAIYCTFDR